MEGKKRRNEGSQEGKAEEENINYFLLIKPINKIFQNI